MHIKLPKPNFDKPFGEWRGTEYTFAILYSMAVGGIVLLALTAPNAIQIFKMFKAHDALAQKKVLKKLRNAARSGYVQKKNGKYIVSEKGKTFLNEEVVWQMQPRIQGRWDGKWRMVVFDIPSKKEPARQAFRARLAELGFKRYQNSVFIHRHDMENVIDPFTRYYGIRPHVRFGTLVELDGAAQVFEGKKK